MSLKKLLDLTGRTALITGGSHGLGLQIAEGFLEMGARVVVSSRKADELEGAAEHLSRLGPASWIAADSSDPAAVARLAEQSIARLGHVDILEDLKGAALLFASDAGRHITGQILAVDGGASAY